MVSFFVSNRFCLQRYENHFSLPNKCRFFCDKGRRAAGALTSAAPNLNDMDSVPMLEQLLFSYFLRTGRTDKFSYLLQNQ